MRKYSEFFQTLHDEVPPYRNFGRGTHYSVLRAVVFGDSEGNLLGNARFQDFAVVWDEDHDERVIEPLRDAEIEPVIPTKASRKEPRPYDKDLYKARSLIENFFCKLKQFRAIATRYDKTAQNFLAAIHLSFLPSTVVAGLYLMALAFRLVAAAQVPFPATEPAAYYASVAASLVGGEGLVSHGVWSYATPPLVVPKPAF